MCSGKVNLTASYDSVENVNLRCAAAAKRGLFTTALAESSIDAFARAFLHVFSPHPHALTPTLVTAANTLLFTLENLAANFERWSLKCIVIGL